MRKPSIKRSIKARTTGRAKRAVKKKVIPGYGKKEWDGLRIPKKRPITKCIRRHPFRSGIYSRNESVLKLGEHTRGGKG